MAAAPKAVLVISVAVAAVPAVPPSISAPMPPV